MIKKLALTLILISSSLTAMEITPTQLAKRKAILIQNRTEELTKKLIYQNRVLDWSIYATGGSLIALIASKFGYNITDKIGARGYLLMAGGFGLFTVGNLIAVGKLDDEIKKVPELINDEYVKNHIENCRKPKI